MRRKDLGLARRKSGAPDGDGVSVSRLLIVTASAIVVWMLVLGSLACSSDDDDLGFAPTLPPEPIDEQARPILEAMVLTVEDVDNELDLVGARYSTNTDVAGGLEGAQQQLDNLREWGRRLGHDVEFAAGLETPADNPIQGLQNSMSLYLTAEGASASLMDGVDSARELDWKEVYEGLYLFRFEELEHDPIDDESVWFRASGYQQDGRLVIDDQAVFRTGPVRGFLRVLTVHPEDVPRDIFQDEVEQWMHILSERVKAVIASTPEAAPTLE